MTNLQAKFRVRASVVAIGRLLRARRLSQNISQVALARKAGVSAKFIGEFERGVVNCSLVTLLLLTEGVDCTLADLMPPEQHASYLVLTGDDVRRVKDALAVIDATTTPKIGKRRMPKGAEPKKRHRRVYFPA